MKAKIVLLSLLILEVLSFAVSKTPLSKTALKGIVVLESESFAGERTESK